MAMKLAMTLKPIATIPNSSNAKVISEFIII